MALALTFCMHSRLIIEHFHHLPNPQPSPTCSRRLSALLASSSRCEDFSLKLVALVTASSSCLTARRASAISSFRKNSGPCSRMEPPGSVGERSTAEVRSEVAAEREGERRGRRHRRRLPAAAEQVLIPVSVPLPACLVGWIHGNRCRCCYHNGPPPRECCRPAQHRLTKWIACEPDQHHPGHVLLTLPALLFGRHRNIVTHLPSCPIRCAVGCLMMHACPA